MAHNMKERIKIIIITIIIITIITIIIINTTFYIVDDSGQELNGYVFP